MAYYSKMPLYYKYNMPRDSWGRPLEWKSTYTLPSDMPVSTPESILAKMSDDELESIKNKIFLELTKRDAQKREQARQEAEAEERTKARFREVIPGFCNFLLGAAHAMACRYALRWSKGHAPFAGKTPQSGEMWTPVEIATVVKCGVLGHHRKNNVPAPVVNEHNASTYINDAPMLWESADVIKLNLPRFRVLGSARSVYF